MLVQRRECARPPQPNPFAFVKTIGLSDSDTAKEPPPLAPASPPSQQTTPKYPQARREMEVLQSRQVFDPRPSSADDLALPGLKALTCMQQRWQEQRVTSFRSGSESPEDEDEAMLDVGPEFTHHHHNTRDLSQSPFSHPLDQQQEAHASSGKNDEDESAVLWSPMPNFSPEEVEMLALCVSPMGGGSSKSSFDAADMSTSPFFHPGVAAPAPASSTVQHPRLAATTSCIARCTIRRKSSLQPPLKPDWVTSRKSRAHAPLAADMHAARQQLGLKQEAPAPSAAAPAPSHSGDAAAQGIAQPAASPQQGQSQEQQHMQEEEQQQQRMQQPREDARRSFGAASSAPAPAHLTPSRPGPGLACLTTDMKPELELLQQALAIPTSPRELPCVPMTELDQSMLSCLHRRGKGGRNPSSDARLDPNVDPKKAMRIMANRMSAARSKLKQKLLEEGQRVKLDMLRKQKARLLGELAWLQRQCMSMEAANQETLVLSPRQPAPRATPNAPSV